MRALGASAAVLPRRCCSYRARLAELRASRPACLRHLQRGHRRLRMLAEPDNRLPEAAESEAGGIGGPPAPPEGSHEHSEAAQLARQRRLWLAAAKPPMYSVAIVPILVGAGAAYAATGVVYFARCGQLLLGSILVIAWLNLSNDAFDAETGADANKAESIVALIGNRRAVLAAANVSLLGGVLLLGRAVADSGDLRVGLVLAAAIFMGYLYQGPPFRRAPNPDPLSYLGLGEPLCFLAFGPFATCAFYLAQVASGAPPGTTVLPMVSWPAMAASVIVGTTTAAVLFCSHFHQVASDRSAKKLSPVVRLGTDRAMQVLTGSVAFVYGVSALCVSCRILPLASGLLLMLSLPLAVELLTFGWRTHGDAGAVWPLKLYALSWHMAVGVALAAGLCLCRMPPPVVPAFVISARERAVRLWQAYAKPLPKMPPPALPGPPAPQPPPPPPPPLPAA